MAYQATVIPIMIASPGDVKMERNIIRDAILEWNNVHAFEEKVILHPVSWDTHSSPELADRPQELINTRLLKKCDLLVGVLGTKLGTPTGKSKSGTIEEIEEHYNAGKPVMLYFSLKDLSRTEFDKMPLIAEVEGFKQECREYGIVEDFKDDADLEKKFAKQLQIALNENSHLKKIKDNHNKLTAYVAEKVFDPITDLSDDEKTLLLAASKDRDGLIVKTKAYPRELLVGDMQFGGKSTREFTKWLHVTEQLAIKGLLVEEGLSAFVLTHEGWNTVEQLGLDSDN